MSNSKNTKATALATVLALIAGTQKHTPNGSLTFAGVTYTAASLIQLLQSLADAMTASDAASATAKDALLAERAVDAKVAPVVTGYRTYLRALNGSATQTLADYGLAPTKTRKTLTVEAKSASVALNQATRKARGTMGPQARLKIKGTVAAKAEQVSAPPAPAPAKPNS